ncbi:ATP-dependent protease La domain protein LonD [Candidatus Terasakiella magnetica]|uniref:ATP-dependent protease La domain protein LonD n=1 Tax=Candidatus Terasakiella magnetica TaxID=1867952 RepID=A0A1C3RIZ6_9PROT|nr:LON peptidase substrate-binding domain-containing protein [Candidatus Terasakiella magnetica]SCA57234.1 ATP-dependent protease La domain protein LonD [Candidatus Terasakiella magnetica]
MGPLLPETLPLFPLTGALLLPRGQLPLNIFEPRYLTMIEDALGVGRMIGMIQPCHDVPDPIPDSTAIYSVGCLGKIVEFRELEDSRFLVTLAGISRFKVEEELEIERGYRRAAVDYSAYKVDLSEQQPPVNRDALIKGLRHFLDLNGPGGQEMMDVNWDALEQAPDEDLVNALSMLGPFEPREKQALLEAVSLTQRAETLITMMSMAALSHEDGSSGHA